MRQLRIALAALAVFATGCLDNESVGPLGTPVGGTTFAGYIALGTSISAGIQSAGINDSTQRRAFPYLLAKAMGFTPNANWYYPGFSAPGCPPPYRNPLTQTRVGGGADTTCNLVSPVSVPSKQGYFNNLGVPSIRAAQVLNIRDLSFPATDSLFLSQFITGSRNPIDIVLAAKPAFVTLEIGSDDVIHAATYGDTAYLTSVANFQTQFTAIADTIALTGAKVAVANIPNMSVIPHFSPGVILWCLHNGGPTCPAAAGFPDTAPPFNKPGFIVDSSCIATAVYPSKGSGDSMLVSFPAIAQIAGTLQAGGAATLDCGAGTATVNQGAGFKRAGSVLAKASVKAIVTRLLTFNAFIQAQATTRGWAFVDLNGLLTASAALIPKFPHLATPDTLFGTLFSLDGIHPSNASHKAIADAFVAAINGKYGTTLTPP